MDLPRYHRLTPSYYRLEGQSCTACGAVQFPPRQACGACRGGELEPYRFSGRGTVFSFAEVAQAPKGFSAPYMVAMVELEEGVRVTAQLTDVDPEEVEIGMPKGTTLKKADARPVDKRAPIVFYGTSITQGGCASRPGMVHTAILGRKFDRPVTNLGFLSEPIWGTESVGVTVTPSPRPCDFVPGVEAVLALTADQRARLGRAAAAWYRRRFAPECTVARLRAAATSPTVRAGRP